MGTVYSERFNSSIVMANWIKKNEIGWIIIEKSTEADDLPASRMLRQALRSGLLDASLVMSVHSARGQGEDLNYMLFPPWMTFQRTLTRYSQN